MNIFYYLQNTSIRPERMIVINAMFPFTIVLIGSVIMAFVMIPLLKKIGAGQVVRDDGPQSHLKKSGTPTMGGWIFLIPLTIFSVWFPSVRQITIAGAAIGINDFLQIGIGLPLLATLGLFVLAVGFVGFADDFIKIKIERKGLSPIRKSMLLLLVILAFTIYYLYFSGIDLIVYRPFSTFATGGIPIVIQGYWKIIYGIFIVFVLYVTSNSVNITDGVDGLASSVTAIAATFLGIVGSYLDGQTVRTASMFSFAIAAGCAAFFLFNKFPAKVMMGDTGSLALGAGISAAAIIMGMVWIIPLIGAVYALESLSVMIQVYHFKKTGKRIFRMAPIHHHFELAGWKESKVVSVFSFITLCGCLIAVYLVSRGRIT